MTSTEDEKPNEETAKLIDIELDTSLAAVPSADVEHERQVAIFDLLQENSFHVVGRDQGPYKLRLSIAEGRLMFGISDQSDDSCAIIGLALSPFRRIVKDYFMICDSYFQAIRTSTPSQIETIDMARRGLHNEGSEILKERLRGKIDIDFDTARRLFTLVCVLHWRG
ncbi:MAG: UPF0262 family protein [Rhizobiales bacterium]|nr:UPF0262 family protein [Hyphomicrobiales bacterium]